MEPDDKQPLSLISSPDSSPNASPDTSGALHALPPLDTPDRPDTPDMRGDDPNASGAFVRSPETPESPETPIVEAQELGAVAPSPLVRQLIEDVVYRPGAGVALALLAGPAICAIVGAVAIGVSGAIPLWLPFAPLLWLPALALVWALLKSVRLTPDTLACGRALGQWRSVAFDDVERVEQHGWRLVVSARGVQPLTFTPVLLHRGAQLRRSLLLRLPLAALVGELRAEAQRLSEGGDSSVLGGDISGILTVQTRTLWPTLAGALAVALLASSVAVGLAMASPLNIALALILAALAGVSAIFCLWSAQKIFVTEKGLIIQYALLRSERDVAWAQVKRVEYGPGEVALLFRGKRRMAISAGPGLLTATHARLMRQFISRYSLAEVAPALRRTGH